jgi:hypothetical protein
MTETPLISLTIDHRTIPYLPGETLQGEYQIDHVRTDQLAAVELSVMWRTSGKGDEDIGVHYFDRQSNETSFGDSLGAWRRFSTVLPRSPLSYDGVIVKILWCVRVRVFLRTGHNFLEEQQFLLGNQPAAILPQSELANSSEIKPS